MVETRSAVRRARELNELKKKIQVENTVYLLYFMLLITIIGHGVYELTIRSALVSLFHLMMLNTLLLKWNRIFNRVPVLECICQVFSEEELQKIGKPRCIGH